VHEALLARPGFQDLTAHVNFSHLEDAAAARGLRPLGRTTQDRFLVVNGILERFTGDPEAWGTPSQVARRRAALQLLHPDGMGRRFHVLFFEKGETGESPIRGLADPFRGGPGNPPL
jgi:SAM-dependent MidA family methyltransferase